MGDAHEMPCPEVVAHQRVVVDVPTLGLGRRTGRRRGRSRRRRAAQWSRDRHRRTSHCGLTVATVRLGTCTHQALRRLVRGDETWPCWRWKRFQSASGGSSLSTISRSRSTPGRSAASSDRTERARQRSSTSSAGSTTRPGAWSASRVENLLDVSASGIAGRGVARTFQNLALYPTMTVIENVMVGATSRSKTNWVTAAFRVGAGA